MYLINERLRQLQTFPVCLLGLLSSIRIFYIQIPSADASHELNQPMIIYHLPEESPRGTLVGHIGQDLIHQLTGKRRESLHNDFGLHLSITNWPNRFIQLFSLDNVDHTLRIAITPDREVICPIMIIGDDTSQSQFIKSNEFDLKMEENENYVIGYVAPVQPCLIDLKIAYRFRNSNRTIKRMDEPSLFIVRIEIEDINDHAPNFPQSRLVTELGEMTSIPQKTIIEIPTAFDLDNGRNGSILYWLDRIQSVRHMNKNHEQLLSVSSMSKQLPFNLESDPLRLVLIEPLDWEAVTEYNLIIHARDCELPKFKSSQLNVHISIRDENDNVPTFAQKLYTVTINESVLRGAIILELGATDLDGMSNGQMTFSLAPPLDNLERNALKYFGIRSIAADRAAIYVIQTPDVDEKRSQGLSKYKGSTAMGTDANFYEVHSEVFTFHLVVRDNGFPRQLSSRAKVTVQVLDVNDMTPTIFVSYINLPISKPGEESDQKIPISSSTTMERSRGRLRENTNRAFIAFVTVQDFDSGIWGQIQCQTDNAAFILVPVSDSNPFKFDSTDSHLVNLHTAPMLSTHSREVGFKLLAIQQFDREKISEITFHIICVDNAGSTSQNFPLLVHPNLQNNGILQQTARGSVPQLTGTALVRILIDDENDNAPTFHRSQYRFIIDESDGSSNKSPRTPNRNEIERFVGQIKATDPDQTSRLKFYIDHPLVKHCGFYIEQESGKLFTNKLLDREEIIEKLKSTRTTSQINGLDCSVENEDEVYLHVPVMVTDSMHNVTTNILVRINDVNDNTPIFEKTNYAFCVAENQAPIHSGALGTVEATDADSGMNSKITYHLLDVSETIVHVSSKTENQTNNAFMHKSFIKSLFTISTKSGQLHLIHKLDREEQTHHIFYVVAIDNSRDYDAMWTPTHEQSRDIKRHTATATVTVIVDDVNDNAPKITYPPPHGMVSIEAGSLAGHNLFTVLAEDPDNGENGTVRFTLSMTNFEKKKVDMKNDPTTSITIKREMFSIDPVTGIVFVVDKLSEQPASYLLVLGAHDLGKPEQRKVTSTVTIHVQNSRMLQALNDYRSADSQSPRHKDWRSGKNNGDPKSLNGNQEQTQQQTHLSQSSLSQQHSSRVINPNAHPVGHFVSLTDRAVFIILAIIFALLLLTTVVLILLIKRRRDQERWRRAGSNKSQYNGQTNHNATLMRQDGSLPWDPLGIKTISSPCLLRSSSCNVLGEDDLDTMQNVRTIVQHNSGPNTEYGTTLYGRSNVYTPENVDAILSVNNDYQRMYPRQCVSHDRLENSTLREKALTLAEVRPEMRTFHENANNQMTGACRASEQIGPSHECSNGNGGGARPFCSVNLMTINSLDTAHRTRQFQASSCENGHRARTEKQYKTVGPLIYGTASKMGSQSYEEMEPNEVGSLPFELGRRKSSTPIHKPTSYTDRCRDERSPPSSHNNSNARSTIGQELCGREGSERSKSKHGTNAGAQCLTPESMNIQVKGVSFV